MIKRVSASKLETYVSCPYRYYIKYVKELGKRSIRTDSMHYGTMVHEILKDFHAWVRANPLPLDDTEMRKIIYFKVIEIIQGKIEKYHKSLARPVGANQIYKDHIEIYLNGFFYKNEVYKRNFEGEKDFNIPIADIAATMDPSKLSPLVAKYGDVVLNGKIDLIIYPDIVVDFKTQGIKSFEKKFIANFQTILYTLIRPVDVSFIYIFLWKKLEMKEIHMSADTRAERLNDIVKLIHTIETSVYYNKNQTSCKNCIFRHLCSSVH